MVAQRILVGGSVRGNAMRMQRTARVRLRLSQNPHFGKASYMRSNAGLRLVQRTCRIARA